MNRKRTSLLIIALLIFSLSCSITEIFKDSEDANEDAQQLSEEIEEVVKKDGDEISEEEAVYMDDKGKNLITVKMPANESIIKLRYLSSYPHHGLGPKLPYT